MTGNSKKPLTIFMYPWFAMSHLTSFILAANKFADRGHKIFIVVPPNAQSKLGSLNLHPDSVQFRPIFIPLVEGLPAQAQTSNDIPIYKNHLLMKALDLTQPEIETMLCEIKPDYVFGDVMHWLPGLARSLKIKSINYSTVSPASMCVLFSDVPSIEDVEVKQRFLMAISESDAVGFKTCREIEGQYCELLEKKLKKPILLAGPVVPIPQTLTLDENWANWLDRLNPKSVIYCAFGSEAILEKDQFQQLLLGIELTGFPFLIALKPPSGVEKIEEALPEGFEERTKERGVVHGGWVQQQLILKHTSVGCFVTHCGYGSMWEGLMSECQLVVLPHAGDQYVNARLMSVDLKVGVRVEKGDEDGLLFTKEGVHFSIMAAMADESGIGKEVKAKHDEVRKVLLSKGFGDSYFDGFVEKLKTLV